MKHNCPRCNKPIWVHRIPLGIGWGYTRVTRLFGHKPSVAELMENPFGDGTKWGRRGKR